MCQRKGFLPVPSMAQFIDETGGELEEMNLQSSYEKHMPSVVF